MLQIPSRDVETSGCSKIVRSSHPQRAPRRRSSATPHKVASEDGGEMAVFQQPVKEYEMLQLDNLTKEFAGRDLFRGISWQLNAGERVGLVGENGAGKSTLMRIIAGEVETSSGEIRLVRGATVGYL